MEKITCAAELKLAIQNLEFQQEVQGQLLKDHFFVTFESLKPINLIKNTLLEITSSPYLIDNLLGAIMGMISGSISKKIAVGTSNSLIRKILGAALQFGVTNIVAQHPDILKSVGNFIIDKFIHKKNKDQHFTNKENIENS